MCIVLHVMIGLNILLYGIIWVALKLTLIYKLNIHIKDFFLMKNYTPMPFK